MSVLCFRISSRLSHYIQLLRHFRPLAMAVSQTYLSLMTLIVLRSTDGVFCRLSHYWNLFNVLVTIIDWIYRQLIFFFFNGAFYSFSLSCCLQKDLNIKAVGVSFCVPFTKINPVLQYKPGLIQLHIFLSKEPDGLLLNYSSCLQWFH